jgi:protein-S-isoprenylcysteine O-methyltransferase Ste14
VKLFLKNMLFTIIIPGTVAVYIPLIIMRGTVITSPPLLLVIGILLMVVGGSIYAWTVWDFASYGRGTPLPIDAPIKLVVRGLYQYIRNPMYLGVILVILGWSAIFASGWLLIYALVVWVVMNLFVSFYEEPQLKMLFGTEYEAYRAAVRRWVPRIRCSHSNKF